MTLIPPRLRGHLRRSSALIVALVTLGLIIWTSWIDFHRWRWEWDWGMLNSGSGWPVFAALLAAGTAIDAVRARALLEDMLVDRIEVKRSAWPAFLLPTAVVAGIWIASLLPAAAVLHASEAIGQVHWWGLLGQASGIVMFGATGALLGMLVPRWWMPPLVGLGAYFGPYLGLFALNLWVPVPSVAGGYILGVPDLPHSPILITVIASGLVLILAPMSRGLERLGVALIGLASLAHIVLLPAILADQDEVPSVDIAGCEYTAVLRLEVCATSPFTPFLQHVGQVADTVFGSSDVPIPRLILASLRSVGHLRTDSGVLVGVHAGMVRPEWRPDQRVLPNDLRHQLLESVLGGFCGPSDLEWARQIAQELLFWSSLPGWPGTFEETYARRFHVGESPPSQSDIRKLWDDVAQGCHEARLRTTLVGMGISE